MISKIFSSIQSRIQTIQNRRIEKRISKQQEGPKYRPVDNSSQIILGKDFVLDLNNPKLKEQLEKKGEVEIGSSAQCDIITPSFYNGIYPTHLLIKHKNNQTMISEGNPNANVKIVEKNNINPFYFGTRNIKFAQENTGDCYLLATLYGLSRTNFGEEFLKQLVALDKNGNYVVKFYNTEPITVKENELYGNKTKKCVSGELGLRAIERAYGKLINPLYGDKKTRKIAAKRNFFYLDKGGFMTIALEKLTGLKTNQYNIKELNLEEFLPEIKEYGLEHQIITCSTPNKGINGDYMDKESKFLKAHAYAIKDINVENETIEIINPHNTKKSEIISWKEFKKMFEYLCIARLKKDTQK